MAALYLHHPCWSVDPWLFYGAFREYVYKRGMGRSYK